MKKRDMAATLFGAAIAVHALLVVVGPTRSTKEERIDLGRLERRHLSVVSGAGVSGASRACSAELPRFTALQLSDDARLVEDGVPLAHPDASLAAIAAPGSGGWCIVAKHAVVWASSDGSDPIKNGRRYELLVKPNGAFTTGAFAVAFLAGALGVAAWALGGLELRGRSRGSVRALVVCVTVASLGAGLSRGWDRILVGPDAPAVFTPSPVRTPLYPSFVEALDRKYAEPRTGILADEGPTPRRDPAHRLIFVVQAQKILTVLAIAALVFELTAGINAWLVGALAYFGVLADLLRAGPGSVHFDMNVIGAEGLDHALVIVFLAATFAYMQGPTGRKGAILALVLTLLVSNHPSNVTLAAVFPAIWFLHVGRGETCRQASFTTAGLAFVFLVPLAVHVAEGARATGRLELACTPGSHAVPLAVQVGTPEDTEAFEDDPSLKELARVLLVENAPTKIKDYNEVSAARCIDANLRRNVLPAFARTIKVPQGQAPEVYAEGVFREVSRRLIARHGDDYAKLVLVDFTAAWDWAVQGPALLTILIAGALFWRTRAYELLFVAAFGALPLVALLPACAVGCATARDRAGLGFAEPLALGLLAATLWTLGQRAFEKPGEEE